MSANRRLAAIMVADVVGYSRLMEADEAGTLAGLESVRGAAEKQIADHSGRIANTAGDSVVAEFGSAVGAVSCAMIIQELLAQSGDESRGIRLRIGIHIGDVLPRGDDLFGTAVNVAARLEAVAQPGGIVVSASVKESVAGKLPACFRSLGQLQLKNITEPVESYSVAPDVGGSPASIEGADQRLPFQARTRLSIAVLPFANMSREVEQESLADGIAEDLITELSRLKDYLVIARNTAFTYKGRAVDVVQVGRELGVSYVLEGSVRQLGGKLRITAQLIETAHGNHVWAEKYDRDMAAMFDVQDDVIRAVVASTHTRLIEAEGELATRARTADLDGWALMARGRREIYRNTRDSLTAAEEITKLAIARDPANAKARSLLAWTLMKLVTMGYRKGGPERTAEIATIASDAARLDPQDEYCVWIHGMVLHDLMGRADEAILYFERALAINPNLAAAYGTLGAALTLVGRMDEAIIQIQTAIRLNPRDPTVFHRYTGLAEANFKKCDYSLALHWASQALALKPDYWYAAALATASAALNDDKDAAALAAEKLRLCLPDASLTAIKSITFFSPEFWGRLSDGLAKAGIPANGSADAVSREPWQ